MQATDGVDIVTVFAADEDFELRIDRACISNERANHLDDGIWGEMHGDERMTLEEFLVGVERQEAVGGGAGNGVCCLSEVKNKEFGFDCIDERIQPAGVNRLPRLHHRHGTGCDARDRRWFLWGFGSLTRRRSRARAAYNRRNLQWPYSFLK